MTHDTPRNLARFRELADAYGADPAHWPVEERSWAADLASTSSAAAAVLSEARRLDELLDLARPAVVDAALFGRVLADAPRRPQAGLLQALWPFGPIWRPVAGLAFACLLGVMVPLAVDRQSAEAGLWLEADRMIFAATEWEGSFR